MINIQLLRSDPKAFAKYIARKKFDCDLPAFLELDKQRRLAVTKAENARAHQKYTNGNMAGLVKGSPAFLEKVKEMKLIAKRVKELETIASDLEKDWKAAWLTIPNLPDSSVPYGRGETDNQVIQTWKPSKSFSEAIPHYNIPWFPKAIDFQRGSKVTGAGFPFYLGDMARLVRALIQFFIEEACDAGYEEVLPPLLVNSFSATATGQLPDKEGQMYEMPSEGLYAIPTAEVPVTNFWRDEIIPENMLPLKSCAYSPCFRREAGSWGADVRGLNRLHQFDKVELVQWVLPENSDQALEDLRKHAEMLLKKLEIPFRSLKMCSGDIGFPHSKQYDLEVWAAGQKRWLEVSSCSNFTDFQARRANIRYRSQKGKVEPVHTLNASGLALPRTLAAILENNYSSDEKIKVPEVLKPWVKKDYIGESYKTNR